jgi:hypothetical protein
MKVRKSKKGGLKPVAQKDEDQEHQWTGALLLLSDE